MIYGAHLLLFSRDPEADRAFLRDVLGWPYAEDPVEAPGWLIFAAPPTEVALHPTDAPADAMPNAALHLMCTDLTETLGVLAAHGYEPLSPVSQASWGATTTIGLPSGAVIGLYQPRHASPLSPEGRVG